MYTRLVLNSSLKVLGLLSFQTVVTGFAAFFPIPDLQSWLSQEAPHVALKALQLWKDIYSLIISGPSGVLDAKLDSAKPAVQSLWITFLGVSHCIGGCLGVGWERPCCAPLSASTEKYQQAHIWSACTISHRGQWLFLLRSDSAVDDVGLITAIHNYSSTPSWPNVHSCCGSVSSVSVRFCKLQPGH